MFRGRLVPTRVQHEIRETAVMISAIHELARGCIEWTEA